MFLILINLFKFNVVMIIFVIFFLREFKNKVKFLNVYVWIVIYMGDIVIVVLGVRYWKYDFLGDDVIRVKYLLERVYNG